MDICQAIERLNRLNMATKTSTETRREITRQGDVVTVKVVETTTTHVPGKDPEVKEITRVEEFKGEEGMKRLPEDIRRQLEDPSNKKVTGPVNKSATRGNFVEDSLAEHNKYRKLHGAEPLKLSSELVAISEKRAKELAAKDELSSRTDHTYGENLSCMWSNDPEHYVNASEIVARWYGEHKNYDFNAEPTTLNAGHFTQMVWASSKEFGIAAAKSDSNKIYVVATYSPSGNFVGEFKKNVNPAGSKPKPTDGVSNSSFPGSKINPVKSSEKIWTPPESAGKSGDLNKDCVQLHNEYRARHGVPPLRFSQELANYAQEWADHLASQDKIEHRQKGRYGENLYGYKSSDPNALATAADACKSWYGEIQLYDFNKEQASHATGHFTQMIWKGSTEVGMGRAKSKSGVHVIVANYNPPGNFIGTFKANVPKPIK